MKGKLLRTLGKVVVCRQCGKAGGTLVKVEDGVYEHQNRELCRIFQLARK